MDNLSGIPWNGIPIALCSAMGKPGCGVLGMQGRGEKRCA